MNHIDQQTLELYVLGDKSTIPLREEIEAHLDKCAGCRELLARMEDVHAGFAASMNRLDLDQSASSLPERRWHSKTPSRGQTPLQEVTAEYAVASSRWETMIKFVKVYPIPVASGGLFLLVLGALFATLALEDKLDDVNPTYFHANTASGKVEFVNQAGNVLWELTSFPSEVEHLEVTALNRARFKRLIVFDLDTDGRNEIFSALRLPQDNNPSRSFRVFDGSGVEKQRIEMSLPKLAFREFTYSTLLDPIWIESVEGSPKSMLAGWTRGRSPMVVARYDARYQQAGTYWHFGQLVAGYEEDITGDGVNEMIVCGTNDVDDHLKTRRFVMTAIKPSAIDGESESTASRGFGYPPSKAELFYVSLPSLNIFQSLESNRGILLNSTKGQDFISVLLADNSPGKEHGFEYVFSKDFHLIDIKWSTGLRELMNKLKSKGEMDVVLDEALIARLKQQIEWWDGERWQNSWTPVKVK